MSIRHGSVDAVHGRIDRAQARATRSVIECEVGLTSKSSHPGTKIPGLRQVRIDRQSAIHESNGSIELMGYEGEHICTHAHRCRVICSQMHRFPAQPRSFGTLLHTIDHPATRFALDVAPSGHAIGARQTGVEFDRLAKELERIAVRIPGPTTNAPTHAGNSRMHPDSRLACAWPA